MRGWIVGVLVETVILGSFRGFAESEGVPFNGEIG